MNKPIRKAVRTFIIKNNKVLAIKYLTDKNKNFYDIPGGKIEDGETNLDTSIRECLEETGIQIINQKSIGNLIVEYPEMIFDFDIIICDKFQGNQINFVENESMWIKINDLINKKQKFPCIELLKPEYNKCFKYEKFKLKFVVDENHKIIQKEIHDNN